MTVDVLVDVLVAACRLDRDENLWRIGICARTELIN